MTPPTVVLNGEPTTVEPGATVADLVARLGLPDTGIAVAVGDDVVPRSRWAATPLPDAAQVEIVTAMQGG